jgi:hypothetical protein
MAVSPQHSQDNPARRTIKMDQGTHLRRINKNEMKDREISMRGGSCHWGWFSFPMRPEPATDAVSTQVLGQKKQAAA